VVGYLRGFLFSAKRALTPVASLSGGERNRVILAKLFTQPSNLLVLDEPTNDLDVETLEVLEERLSEYSGTLLVVSHDREFLDNIVTSILVFEAGGRIVEYAGGYSDWVRRGRELAQMDALARNRAVDEPAAASNDRPAALPSRRQAAKLGYLEQRELDGLPDRIEALEAELAALESRVTAPEFYGQAWEQTQPVLDAVAAKHAEHDRLAARWLELEERRAALAAGLAR
jgi:ABC transport system ATP-binding/permease protein